MVSETAANRGSYHYLLNGGPTEVQEHWSLSGDFSRGDCFVDSVRTAPGVEISVQAKMQGQQVIDFHIQWQGWQIEPVEAHYGLGPDALKFELTRAGAIVESKEFPYGDSREPPVLFPLMRIFTGPLMASLLQRGGSVEVVLPSIADPKDDTHLLRPDFSARACRVIHEREILSWRGSKIPCRCCEYTGGQYGADSRFWLGDDDFLVRYQWQQAPGQDWDVWMEREVH